MDILLTATHVSPTPLERHTGSSGPSRASITVPCDAADEVAEALVNLMVCMGWSRDTILDQMAEMLAERDG